MTGVNDSNETFFEVSGRGALSSRRAMDVLRGRVEAGSVVATDKATAYADVLAELDVAAHLAYDSRDRSKGTINRVNAVHSMLASFMGRFRGVSTKHLTAYLEWFRWCRTFLTASARAGTRLSPVSSPTASAASGPASFSTWPRPTWTIGVPRDRSRLKWWHRGIRER